MIMKTIFKKSTTHDINYTVVIRESGNIDLYFSAFKVFSSYDCGG